MKRLLAKSYDHKKYKEPPRYALLTQHSRDVAAACKALAQISGCIALRNTEIENEWNNFDRTLRAVGWLEDLGKSSSHFQEMLTSNDGIQLIRH